MTGLEDKYIIKTTNVFHMATPPVPARQGQPVAQPECCFQELPFQK